MYYFINYSLLFESRTNLVFSHMNKMWQEENFMTILEMQDKFEIQDLVNVFANLADIKDAKSQGDLFLEDGKLEFQMGFDGEIHDIIGREALVAAFKATIEPCIAVYHLNGQHTITLNGDKATGTAYCQATLISDVDGKSIVTVNDVRYNDLYKKVDGKWYIEKRRTTFLISEKHEMNG